ncbi:MAG: PaaX family transcriptional regulator C-terminal domain-containing protein [Acidimicrobiales bacterium]
MGPAPDDRRPLTARSVVASTLLGIDPPRLSTALLVRSGELFGISGPTTRVALSRMVAAGELEPDPPGQGAGNGATGQPGGYRLAGSLLARQARQAASRTAERRRWKGDWEMAVVADGRRSASDRADLRAAMSRLRLAEVREGVWLRPDNLDGTRVPEASVVVAEQCTRYTARPDDEHPAELAARLWDLDQWSRAASGLRAEMDALVDQLEGGDTAALAPGFVLSAAVLRHLLADPLLPPELLPPSWSGDPLRAEYDRYDRAFKAVWRDWFRQQQP